MPDGMNHIENAAPRQAHDAGSAAAESPSRAGPDLDAAAEAVALLADPEFRAELRGLPKGGGARSEVVDPSDRGAVRAAVGRLAADGAGVYLCLGPVRQTTGRGGSARDEDVVRRRWLFLDIDPDRPAGVCATDAEKRAAAEAAEALKERHAGLGWPEPVEVDSGNGRYLLYHADLPNDEATDDLLRAYYRGLPPLGGGAHLDLAVKNAARIARIPGTWNTKGAHTPERPHRMARLLRAPSPGGAVTAAMIRAATPEAPAPARARVSQSQAQLEWRATASGGEARRRNAYVRSALEGEATHLAGLRQGCRNVELNKSAFRIGQLLHLSDITESEAKEVLMDACRVNGLLAEDGERKCADTIERGLRDGRLSPCEAPPPRDAGPAPLPPAESAPGGRWSGGADAGDEDAAARLEARIVEDAKAAYRESLRAERLSELASLMSRDPGRFQQLLELFKDNGLTARRVEDLRRAIKQQRKAGAKGAGGPPPGGAGGGGGGGDDRDGAGGATQPLLANYRTTSVKVGLSAPEIAARLFSLTDGWPRRVGDDLFAPDEHSRPVWLPKASTLMGWMQRALPPSPSGRNEVWWDNGQDLLTQDAFHAYLKQSAERYDAVEEYPHEPPIKGHYYLRPAPAGGTGEALEGLLAKFHPATPADRQLIKAFFMTLFWGGPPGARPAWLFTATNDDGRGGVGAGKSSVVEMGALLAGGSVEIDKDEKISDLKTRMLSAEAATKRLVFLDNLKSLKFDWAQLEGIITRHQVSGHRMYSGEGQRPNTFVFAITANCPAFGRDMASRCLVVQVARPRYAGPWREEVASYIEGRRWDIIADCLAALRRPGQKLATHGRWGSWEDGVLSKLEDPASLRAMLESRQGAVNEDESEKDIIGDYFSDRIAFLGHSPETDVVFIPSMLAAQWVNEATKERLPTNKACQHLKNVSPPTISGPEKYRHRRGFFWNQHLMPAEVFVLSHDMDRRSGDPKR